MENLQVFNYEENEVRTLLINGEPWWVLKDVCDVLGLTTPTRVAERLDEDEVSQTHIIDSLGRSQETNIINEPGLYSVILRSDKAEAKAFKRWITHNVLPALRKTGSYMINESSSDMTLQRAGMLLRAAENRAVPQSERIRLIDEAVRGLTGTGLNTQSVPDSGAELSLMDLPEAVGVIKHSRRKKFSHFAGGSFTVLFYTVTEIADMIGISPAEFDNFSEAHNLKCDRNGQWVRVTDSSGVCCREFMYLKHVADMYSEETSKNAREKNV